MTDDFKYSEEAFADLQMLRYRLNGFNSLSLQQKLYVYCLSKAALSGRDITFDQQGKYNLLIRKTLEVIYSNFDGDRSQSDFKALEIYLKRIWFSSGIYHHYGCEKFLPHFSEDFFRKQVLAIDEKQLPLAKGQTKLELLEVLVPIIFNSKILPKRVNQTDGEDLVKTSACNFYEGEKDTDIITYGPAGPCLILQVSDDDICSIEPVSFYHDQ